jgi:hypothetical protein
MGEIWVQAARDTNMPEIAERLVFVANDAATVASSCPHPRGRPAPRSTSN